MRACVSHGCISLCIQGAEKKLAEEWESKLADFKQMETEQNERKAQWRREEEEHSHTLIMQQQTINSFQHQVDEMRKYEQVCRRKKLDPLLRNRSFDIWFIYCLCSHMCGHLGRMCRRSRANGRRSNGRCES